MTTATSDRALLARANELVAIYGDPKASVAALLCDRHPPDALAYKIIASDGCAIDVTYDALRTASEQFAAALATLGVGPGDRVATLMGKSADYLVTLLSIWRLGAVHVPIFTAFAPAAIAFRLVSASAKVVVCDPSQRHKLLPGEAMPADAIWKIVVAGPLNDHGSDTLQFSELVRSHAPGLPAAILGGEAPLIQIYTSGTTGKPKGVAVPTRAVAAFHAYAELGLGLRSDDFYWCAADPGWAYGLYFGVIASLATGVPSVMLTGGFDVEATYAVLAQGVTNFTAAPTVYRSLRGSPISPPRGLKLRCASSAGEPLTPEVNDWAIDALGVPVHDHYGQTEAGMLINNHHHPALARPLRAGSMGIPMPGWSALILRDHEDVPADDGEPGRVAIDVARSPLAWFSGYVDNPKKSAEKFAAGGRYYLTGDVGRQDADGYFRFSSRDDDVIIMAGYRIGPFDVESAILEHPAVTECAVIATPDSARGELVEAYVVLRAEQRPSAELSIEIQQWVKTRFAAHAYPRKVHFIDALPKTPSGKVQRLVLRQRRIDEMNALDAPGATA
jgi:acetyl-CoA synthetase